MRIFFFCIESMKQLWRCLQNFTVTAQAKNVQKKTVLLVLVIIVAYQNVKRLFTLNVMERVKTGISLFRFPKDNTEKRRWINIISLHQRKGAGDNFRPYDESKRYFVCKHHFKADQIRVSVGIGWKTLKPGVIPCIFNFNNRSKIKPRKSPKKRCLPATNESNGNEFILKKNMKLVTEITYYQSCTLDKS